MGVNTKTEILDAFNRLIQKNDFEKITVDKLCEEAGIGRTTFYRYFKDKYDVMNYNFEKMIDEYFYKREVKSIEELFVLLFTEGERNFKLLHRAFSSTGVNSLHNFIYECSYTITERVAALNGVTLTEGDKLKAEVFSHGASYMFEKWTIGNYDLTPEEAAAALAEFVPDKLKVVTWHKKG